MIIGITLLLEVKKNHPLKLTETKMYGMWRLRSKFTSISVAKFTTFKDLL
jgi:hypothetical protein